MKKLMSILLSVMFVFLLCVFPASAAGKKMTGDSSSTSIQDSYPLAVGSKSTIVGKGTVINSTDLKAIGMNICGWKKNTTTLDNCVGISLLSKYTGYLTVKTVNYPAGTTTVLSYGRGKGINDDGTWYRELTKSSYTKAVTSFASLEGVYSNTDYYYGNANVVNAKR